MEKNCDRMTNEDKNSHNRELLEMNRREVNNLKKVGKYLNTQFK